MNNSIKVFSNVAEVNKALAEWMVKDIHETLSTEGRYTMALSGGSTPKQLYELLANEYSQQIDWQKVHIFFDDERYVPFTDERNNAAMISRALLNKINIPREQVHIMQTDINPEASAAAYETILHQYFDGQSFTFNLVLLGMGEDGHTLSLFPGTAVVNEKHKWVSDVLLDDAENYRITLTAPVVNRARKAVFMVTGAAKANTLKEVLQGNYVPDTFPSQMIRPESGKLYWFIDQQAGMHLTGL